MERLPITSKHLAIAQRIISFVQEQGWDVNGISIERFDERANPFIDHQGEEWKERKLKWALSLSVMPRDEEEVKVPKMNSIP